MGLWLERRRRRGLLIFNTHTRTHLRIYPIGSCWWLLPELLHFRVGVQYFWLVTCANCTSRGFLGVIRCPSKGYAALYRVVKMSNGALFSQIAGEEAQMDIWLWGYMRMGLDSWAALLRCRRIPLY